MLADPTQASPIVAGRSVALPGADAPASQALATKVSAVIVTHNRPALLANCLAALARQHRRADAVIVVDNASDLPLPLMHLHCPKAQVLQLVANQGPAAGFAAGIRAALAQGATHVWLMDDDGAPAHETCLADLLATAQAENAALTCPLVCNASAPERLAFPLRQGSRTRFTVAQLRPDPIIRGFAHLFNGALIRAEAFARIGLPDARLFMRGDEVEFLLRARQAGLRIATDTRVIFLHPACDAEIHPILGGAFYAMVPDSAVKRRCQFRNRGWIFSRYGMWQWLAADHVRYACHYGRARDAAGYADWLRATWAGVFGRLGDPACLSLRAESRAALRRAS